MGMFIYGLISKWYIIIAVPTLVVTFQVMKGLEKAGVIKAAEEIVTNALNEIMGVAQHCTPLIANPNALWDCLQNTPPYISEPLDVTIKKQLTEEAGQNPN